MFTLSIALTSLNANISPEVTIIDPSTLKWENGAYPGV